MRQLSVVAAVLFLAACGTHEKKLGTEAKLASDKGLAVLTVSFNGRTTWPTEVRLWTPPFAVLMFDLEGSTDRWASLASTQMYGTTTAAVYTPELPAGRYDLSAFRTVIQRDLGTSTQWLTYTWPLPAELGSFEVRAGQVTHLGNLIFEEIAPGKEDFALALERNPEIEAAVLKGMLPRVAETATIAEAGWSAQAADILSARRKPMASRSRLLLNPRRLADGSVLGGSSVGQVLLRSASGTWRRLDTGASFQIRTALRLADGRLLAGGEMGRLLVGDREGRAWQVAGNRPPFGVVEWLDLGPDGSVVAMILQKEQTLVVSAPSIDSGSWKELARIRHGAYDAPMRNLTDLSTVQRVGDLLLIEHVPGRLAVFDFAAGALRSVHGLPFRVGNASATEDGTVYAFMRQGTEKGLAISSDRGATWKSQTFGVRSKEITRAYFGTARDGFRLVWNKDEPLTSRRYSRVETTNDGGEHWTPGQELPDLAYFWRLGPSEFVASAEYADGSALWWTRDGGKTWTSERIPDGL